MRETTVVAAVVVLVAALGVVPAASAGVGAETSFAAGAGADLGDARAAGAAVGAPSANAQAACSFPLTVTDETGTEVTVEEEPEDIVTLSPSASQTLWELDASEKVVGVADTAGYLEGASEKEVVTDGQTIKTEVIVGLEPDLVIAPDIIPNEKVEQLRSAGLTVYNVNASTNFGDVYAKTERIGALAGECAAANATVTDMRERVTAIRNAVADEESVGGLYVFFGFTTGSGTFIDSIITSAGLTNVATEVGVEGFTTEPLSREVVANNSEAIEWLVLNDNPVSHPSGDVYNGTYAVQNDQTVVLNENYLNQPAPRTVLALENLTRAVYPDAYAEAQATLEATPTPSPSPTPAETTEGTPDSMATPTETPDSMDTETPTETPTTTANGPGFTVAATVGALVALLVASFARRRR